MSRTVLLIAYHFPPVGGAGAQRAIQLVRYLPTLGFRPVVVTGVGTTPQRWAPLDHELGRDLEASVEVRRLPGPEPPPPSPWRGRAERWLRRTPEWERWWTREAIRAVRAAANEVDLIHATLAPYGTSAAVRRIADEVQVPLVLDLEDPWALDEMMVHATRVHQRLESERMRRTLAVADAVVMNTREAERRVLSAFPELDGRVVAAIPNAFDPRDFEAPAPARADAAFRIVHTGSLHTEFGLQHRRRRTLRRLAGGMTAGVDFTTRSHVYLLEALKRASTERPDLIGPVELHLAGVLTEADRRVAERSPVPVVAHGFLTHPQAIKLIRSADLLFLPLHDVPTGRIGLVPHKTYEYLASRRPILAAVPEGDARDLLEGLPTARVCEPADVDAIAAALVAVVDRWQRGVPTEDVPPLPLARHDARRLASELARLYGGLLASDGATGRESRAGVLPRSHPGDAVEDGEPAYGAGP